MLGLLGAAQEKLDTAAIARAIRDSGADAHACHSVDEAVERAASAAVPGDTIVVMSNGRFEDAPDKILAALLGDRLHP